MRLELLDGEFEFGDKRVAFTTSDRGSDKLSGDELPKMIGRQIPDMHHNSMGHSANDARLILLLQHSFFSAPWYAVHNTENPLSNRSV